MMKKKQILFILMALMLIPLYQNCGKSNGMKFSSTATSSLTSTNGDPSDNNTGNVDPSTPTDPTNNNPDDVDVIPDCHNTQLSMKEFTVTFDTPPGCAWGQDGNLVKRDGYMQARYIQSQDLNLPANAILCDMEFEFPDQVFQYDDHVILTLNDRVLTSTMDFSNMLQFDAGGLIYDWNNMAGKKYDVGGTDIYCNGASSTCIFPDTQVQGRIWLSFPKSVIQNIFTNAPRDVNQIQMITTGDNDDAVDCRHDPISFKVKAYYH